MRITFFDEEGVGREAAGAIEKVLDIAAEAEGVDFCVNIKLTGDDEMRKLNAGYRAIDKTTDVLSFPAYEFEGLLAAALGDIEAEEEDGKVFVGDIAISFPRAREQAADYGHSLVRELTFLALHGTLHLLGYDHETGEDERIMTGRQRFIMDKAGIGRELDG